MKVYETELHLIFYLLKVTQYTRSLCLPLFKPLAFFFVQLNAHSLYQL